MHKIAISICRRVLAVRRHLILPTMNTFLEYTKQAHQLISMGLVADSGQEDLMSRLQCVGFYRLLSYMHPFREAPSPETAGDYLHLRFRPGTDFSRIWRYYLFDRRLRLLIMDAVERVEIVLRSQIAHEWARYAGHHNPQGQPGNFAKKYRKKSRETRLASFQDYYNRSTEDFAYYYKETLQIANADELPVNVFVQFSTFGSLHKLYTEGLPLPVRQKIAQNMGVRDVAFYSKLLALFLNARNMCAHHARVWNRLWKYDAADSVHPKKERLEPIVGLTDEPYWATCIQTYGRESTAFLLTALLYMVNRAATTSRWKSRLVTMFEKESPVRSITREMGFPTDWQTQGDWA